MTIFGEMGKWGKFSHGVRKGLREISLCNPVCEGRGSVRPRRDPMNADEDHGLKSTVSHPPDDQMRMTESGPLFSLTSFFGRNKESCPVQTLDSGKFIASKRLGQTAFQYYARTGTWCTARRFGAPDKACWPVECPTVNLRSMWDWTLQPTWG